MDWDDSAPTLEDQIRSNENLSPTQKTLLIQKSNIDFYRAALLLVPLLILIAFIADMVKGWIGDLIGCAIFGGGFIAYRSLEDKKRRVEIALAEESENQEKIQSQNKKRR